MSARRRNEEKRRSKFENDEHTPKRPKLSLNGPGSSSAGKLPVSFRLTSPGSVIDRNEANKSSATREENRLGSMQPSAHRCLRTLGSRRCQSPHLSRSKLPAPQVMSDLKMESPDFEVASLLVIPDARRPASVARKPLAQHCSDLRRSREFSERQARLARSRPRASNGRFLSKATKECVICFQQKPGVDFPGSRISNNCAHESETCLECIKASIKTGLSLQQWHNVRCPECQECLEYHNIKKYADEATFLRYVSPWGILTYLH